MIKTSSGFTLVELMATVAIAAITVTVAVPAFSKLVQNNQMASQVNEFVTALNAARSAAIARGLTITICQSAEADRNPTTNTVGDIQCSGGISWENGWIVFVDTNDNGVLDWGANGGSNFLTNPANRYDCSDSQECVLYFHNDLSPGYTLLPTGGTRTNVRFDTDGTSAGFNTTWTLNPPNTSISTLRTIVINNTGRVYTTGS